VNTNSPFPDVYASATLSPEPSQAKFTLITSRQGSGSNLSGTSQDTRTWPSLPEPYAILPARWYCSADVTGKGLVYNRHCAVQDMMTLDYQLARETLAGSTASGPQSLGITVSHLPDSTQYPVTHAKLRCRSTTAAPGTPPPWPGSATATRAPTSTAPPKPRPPTRG
jgi:hypothetical protein